ncbi:MAG: flippase-like domain-containing protein [Synergistaceae bacterium]|nr:flippase-like domain-containing protein [Synergistaceae bacterium]
MSVKKGLSVFLLLSFAIGGAVLLYSVDRSSFLIFRQASGLKLWMAFLLVAGTWLLDALKLLLLTRAAGENISYGLSLELTWINYFGAAITPMQSGGGPFQMYIMYHSGISVGKSAAITIVRTILVMLILGMMIPFTVMMDGDMLQFGWGARGFVFYVVILISAVWLALVISIVRPELVKRLAVRIIMLLKRLGLLKPEWVGKILTFVSREIDLYNENLRAFMTTGRRYFIFGVFAAFLQIIVQLSVMPCIIWAFGMPVLYPQCVLAQALFLFLLYFIPTPGGSGAAEGGAALVFSIFVPWNVAGMLGVGWRFLTEYTGILLGAVVAVKRIGWKLANQIMAEDKAGKSAGDSSDGGPPAG